MNDDRDDQPDDWRRSRYDDDRPGRYDDERDDYDDRDGNVPRSRKDPRQAVRGPGLALAVIGWLGVVTSAVTVVACVAVAAEAFGPQPADDVVTAVAVAVFGVVSVVGSLVTAIGGQRMMQCRSYGLAMTAAVLCIGSIVLFGLCGFIFIAFGIWAVVVLAQSDVKREFDRVRRAGAAAVLDDYEDRR